MIRARKIFMSSMLALVVMTAGCGGVIKTEADYKSAAKVRPLEVPPDLLSPSRDDRFSVSASGSASRSEFDRSRTDPRRADQVVLPVQDGMRIERHGDQRTLVVDQPAEKLWPIVRQFWLDNGFALRQRSQKSDLSRPSGLKIARKFLKIFCVALSEKLWIDSTIPVSVTNSEHA